MKENLFFRATQSSIRKEKAHSTFSKLILLSILCISTFFSASALEEGIPQQDQQGIIQDQQGIIYVSDNAIVYGLAEITNARIIKIKVQSKVKVSKKSTDLKIKKQIVIAKTESKAQSKLLPKPSKPKFVFNSTTPDESFGCGNKFNTKNSVINNPTFVAQNLILCQYTELNVPVFVYLLNIYTAEFSKTSELSRFLFSRPPPIS